MVRRSLNELNSMVRSLSAASLMMSESTNDDNERRIEAVPAIKSSSSVSPEQAVNQFLMEIQAGAFRSAVLATRNEAEALDLVQDAMLRWVKSKYDQKPPAEWKPLFFRTLQNRIRDWQRRSILTWRIFYQPPAPTEDSDDDLDMAYLQKPQYGENELEDQLSDSQFSKQLVDALRNLPGRQREVFVLRTWQGLSTRETAVVMGCGEGSVMTHLSRAHNNLREQLQSFNRFNDDAEN